MDMKDFSDANRRRCESADGFNHRLSDWSPSDWMVATLGELGEAANIVKKLNRVRDGIPGNDATESELREALRDEIADAFTYLDLFAQSEGFYLEDASINKFNVVSARIGYPEILSGAADKE
jgi:NTP pyrophosphatase (non-canonical NTP hydrolase)